MVHHIVMWKFKPEIEEGRKADLKKEMAQNLASLVGQVPGLLTVAFVENPIPSSTHDIALITTLRRRKISQSTQNIPPMCMWQTPMCARM